jgi:hypothetical protein
MMRFPHKEEAMICLSEFESSFVLGYHFHFVEWKYDLATQFNRDLHGALIDIIVEFGLRESLSSARLPEQTHTD